MIAMLGYPFALFALAALPVLAGIYFLQSRLRRHKVPSLLLWTNLAQPQQGGLVLNKIKTPLLFFLEVLAILLLAIAAASPLVLSGQKADSYVFVLDDSFSMRAGKDVSCRDRATEAILKELAGSKRYYVKFVLASKTPRLLAQSCSNITDVKNALKNWACTSPWTSIEDAISLGRQSDATDARMIVITDKPAPGTVKNDSSLEWRAFGNRLDNTAIINASRTLTGTTQRCFFEVASFADREINTKFTLADANGALLKTQQLKLEPRQKHQLLFEISTTAPLMASITPDELDFDNHINLLPSIHKQVRVKMNLADKTISDMLEQAVNSLDNVVMTNRSPHIIFQDQLPDSPPVSDFWPVCFLTEPDATAFVGPFVLDKSHAICDGLSLDGVIWSASTGSVLPGFTFISAGNTALVSEVQFANGARGLYFNLNARLSTLGQSPNFPVLIYNLIQYRRSNLPQPIESNIRLGSDALVRIEDGVESVSVTDPLGKRSILRPVEGLVCFEPISPGIYKVNTTNAQYTLAANTMSPDESDLSNCTTGKWGKSVLYYTRNYSSLTWAFAICGLIVLVVHGAIAARSKA